MTRSAEPVRTAEEPIQAAGVARQLAQSRLDTEQARRNAGLSTTFLVLQAQRDLAAAETSELRARLDYRTARADFERFQIRAVDHSLNDWLRLSHNEGGWHVLLHVTLPPGAALSSHLLAETR